MQGNQALDSGGQGFSVDSESAGNDLRDNVAKGNGEEGFLVGGSDHVLLRATANKNDDDGIDLFEGDSDVIDSGNVNDGVLARNGTSGVLVKGSVANDNGEDGIELDGDDASARRNTANDNEDVGIDGSEGTVTDLGANKAKGNGTDDCLNVSCN